MSLVVEYWQDYLGEFKGTGWRRSLKAYDSCVAEIAVRLVPRWSSVPFGCEERMIGSVLVDDVASPGRHAAVVVAVRSKSIGCLQVELIAFRPPPSWITYAAARLAHSIENTVRLTAFSACSKGRYAKCVCCT